MDVQVLFLHSTYFRDFYLQAKTILLVHIRIVSTYLFDLFHIVQAFRSVYVHGARGFDLRRFSTKEHVRS